jgi:enoyl-CoA hydratase/carnithine racemase
MMQRPVGFEIRDGVAHVTVSRPMTSLLDLPTVRELKQALERAEEDGATGVLLAAVDRGATRAETTPLDGEEAAAYVADLAELFASSL